ncbi:hypothetical protein [Tengunoibacter tsumagoiensis]|uniref:Alpha-galactosidase n=1 Tax=Tengunoibacter tsumagoiensis TaxID=2014871 RepID=A0A401ZXH6_9CHLR|nr:hypothetical protein [Tengunoibacter tsumagoiensis]GCE11533.1 hypothetical protein KTT_13920 [Tengunoibacter tsumagoiensis]
MSYFDILRAPDLVNVQREDGWSALTQAPNESWQASGLEVRIVPQGNERHIYLQAPDKAIKRIGLRWQMAIPSGFTYLGDHWERGYGDMSWRSMADERIMPWYFLASRDDHTYGYGVKTGANAFCFWQIDAQGISLWIDVRNGGNGVRLGGRELLAAQIVTHAGEQGERAFQVAQAFCRLLCPNPIVPKQPVYGGNNWYYAYGNSSHQEILDDSKLIAALAPESENRPFMVIDDGWQISNFGQFNGGPWRFGNAHFPDMGRLAQEMKDLGTRPGIWMRPLLTSEKLPESWYLPEAGRYAYTTPGVMLDPSQPAVLEQVRQDIQGLVDWGYELIKHDFSTYDIFGRWGFEMKTRLTVPGWSFADTSKTTAEIILEFYRTIARAAGDALVIGCNTVGHLAAGIFAIQRTGDDTSGRDWERTRKMGINTLAFRMPQQGTFFAVDADCVGLTQQVPWSLNEQWLDLLARSGTPLFVSAAPDAIGPMQEKALRNAFLIASQQRPPIEPLDWQENTTPAYWSIDGEHVQYKWYAPEGVQYPFE